MTQTMQFRDFIFRHNPQTITVTQAAGTASHFCPGRGELIQNLGGRARTVRCQGSFWGNTFGEAVAQLEEFRRKAEREPAGALFIPGVAPFQAHLRELVFEAAGDGRIIPYTMVFVEAEAGA